METKCGSSFLFSFIVIAVAVRSSSSLETIVQPTNCSDVNSTTTEGHLQSLLGDIESDTILILEPGCHLLNQLTPVLDKTNITIIGASNTSIITCTSGVGLIFLDITQLHFYDVTITGCNLNGTNQGNALNNVTTYVPNFSIFTVPSATSIGLLIAHAVDVSMNNIQINDTKGIGVLAINVLGSFIIQSSIFANNVPTSCDRDHAGGGLIVSYHKATEVDYLLQNELVLNDNQFLYNSHCSQATERAIYLSFSFYTGTTSLPILSGGGLTILLAQTQNYSLNVNVDSCTFQNNSSPYGGGIFIGLFSGIQYSNITVNNSLFIKNGRVNTAQFNNNITQTTSGQGVTIIAGLPFPFDNNYDLLSLFSNGHNFITIANSYFSKNIAVSGSGFLFFSRHVISLPGFNPYQVALNNCTFTGNSAYYGGAIYMTEDKTSGVQDGVLVSIRDCTITGNEVISSSVPLQSSTDDSPSIVSVSSLNVSFYGNNHFSQNSGTPFKAEKSVINIVDNITFTHNSGIYGGGIGLGSSSFMVLHDNSLTTFQNNVAFLYGGAIYYAYISTNFVINNFDCFLFFNRLDIYESPVNFSNITAKVRFLHNSSPAAGSTVYGSTLDSCSWRNQLNANQSVYESLVEKGIFEFDPSIDDETFGTASYKFDVSIPHNISVMPGQEIGVNTVPFDFFNQMTSELIYSKVDDNKIQGEQQTHIQDSTYWFLHGNDTVVPLSIRTMEEPVNVTSVPVKIFSVTSGAQAAFYVTIRSCYPGFEFSNSSSNYQTCVCNSELTKKYTNLQCFPATNQFTVPNNLWLGPVNDGDEMLTAHVCFSDYCKIGIKNVSGNDFDSQCQTGFYRKGLLCGQCQDNYSVAFGTNSCQQCSNYDIFLLLYFIGAGFLVFFSIGRIGITVSHGFINSIIFYSNIIVPYQPFLLGQYKSDDFGTSILLFIFSSINLTMGYPACFYDGMTALARTYLNFVFPAYLWVLMGFYTFLARFETVRKRWIKENGASVFATVMLLSYISTLQACTFALSVITIDGASPSLRWVPDPSVAYFGKEHAPIGVFSIIVILIYIIPAPILTMFPSLTFSTRFGTRYIPIYDAFWAPFRPKFHFWIGFRLFLRVIPFLLANFAPYPVNTLLLGIFTVILILIHVVIQPFKGRAQNFLDIYLLLNVLLLVIGSLFTENQIEYFEDPDKITKSVYIGYKIMIYGILILALIPVFLVLCYHVHYRFVLVQKIWSRVLSKWTTFYRNIQKTIKRRSLQKRSTAALVTSNIQNESYGGTKDVEKETAALPQIPTTFSELREPLLDEGELSIRPIKIHT